MKLIEFEDALQMDVTQLRTEIGRRNTYLHEKFNMPVDEAKMFVASILSLGAAAHEKANQSNIKY